MKLAVQEFTEKEYRDILTTGLPLPLWVDPEIVSCYPEKKIWVATAGSELKGVWVVPTMTFDGSIAAKRDLRYLPYTSPFILEKDNLKRKEIVSALFEYAKEQVETIYLPLSPGFNDFQPFQSGGALIEMRHTHIYNRSLKIAEVDSRLRNHISYSQKNVQVTIGGKFEDFRFDIAIAGNNEEAEKRKASAKNIFDLGKGLIISAQRKEELCAGIYIAYDKSSAYLMHSWQLADTPRGTVSNLIYTGINWALEQTKIDKFDFEGSILGSIDYFFSGFNAQISSYGFIHWTKNKEKLWPLLDRSMTINGRLLINNK